MDFEGQSKARPKVVPLFYTQLQKALKISLYSDVTHKGKKNEHTCVLCIERIKAKASNASWPLQPTLKKRYTK